MRQPTLSSEAATLVGALRLTPKELRRLWGFFYDAYCCNHAPGAAAAVKLEIGEFASVLGDHGVPVAEANALFTAANTAGSFEDHISWEDWALGLLAFDKATDAARRPVGLVAGRVRLPPVRVGGDDATQPDRGRLSRAGRLTGSRIRVRCFPSHERPLKHKNSDRTGTDTRAIGRPGRAELELRDTPAQLQLFWRGLGACLAWPRPWSARRRRLRSYSTVS